MTSFYASCFLVQSDLFHQSGQFSPTASGQFLLFYLKQKIPGSVHKSEPASVLFLLFLLWKYKQNVNYIALILSYCSVCFLLIYYHLPICLILYSGRCKVLAEIPAMILKENEPYSTRSTRLRKPNLLQMLLHYLHKLESTYRNLFHKFVHGCILRSLTISHMQ